MLIKELSKSLNTNEFWKEYQNFCKGLPEQDIVIRDLLVLLPDLVKRLGNDAASHQLYKSISTFAQNQPNKGTELYSEIKKSDNVNLIGFIPSILKGIQLNWDTNYLISEINSLLLNDDIILKSQGFAAVLNFEKDVFPKEFVDILKNEFERDLSETSSQVSLITRILGKYRKEIPDANDILIKIAQKNIPQVQYEIVDILNTEISFVDNADLFKQLLFTLVSAKPKYGGIFQNFNYGLFYNHTLQLGKLIVKFLEEWLLYDISRYKDILLFEDTIVRLYEKDNATFKFMITSWLNSDDMLFHRALEQILMKISLREIKDFELCKDYLLTLNSKDIDFITSKIIGYIHFKEITRSMFYSILTARIDNPEIVNNVSAIFKEYIIFNYPSTIDFLQGKKQVATRKEKLIIANIQKAGNKYYDDIKVLPIRNEFSPSEERLKIYNEIHRQGFVKKQQDDEQNDTSFMSSIKKIQLRTGRGMFSKYKNIYTEKTEMQAYNYNAELPRGEFIDPIGQEKIRRLNRLYKRRS